MVAVNRRAMAFVDELRASLPCRSLRCCSRRRSARAADAYAPASLMTAAEAQRYHSAQIQTLADTPVELLTALTLTYADEAIGMVRAAEAAGLPIAISFTVETDGRLASGQSLKAAIEQVDAETDGAPVHYMINCAHPAHFAGALEQDGHWRERLRGLEPTRPCAATRSSTRPMSWTRAIPPISPRAISRCASCCPTSSCSAAVAAPTSGTSREQSPMPRLTQ